MLENEASISLQDLSLLPPSHTPPSSDFLVYSTPSGKAQKLELVAIDTNAIPKIPLRRQACKTCVNQALSCEKCPQCLDRKLTCCRRLECLYDYDAYQQAGDSPYYRSCKCTKNIPPGNANFQIDWRLLALMQRLPPARSRDHKFYLHCGSGALWVTEQQPRSQDEEASAIIYEDNFGIFSFHEHQTRQALAPSLADSNSRHFSSLLKLNIRRYLSTKEAWEVSNLQEECQQIADGFFSHKKLEGIKVNLQSQAVDNAYSNMPSLKFQGKYTQVLVSSSKSAERVYKDCSDWQNEEIVFSYCVKSELIFIRSARYYEEDVGFGNVRGVRVRWKKEGPLGSDAVWFKDRKGDIFAIWKGILSIFKFHIPTKSFEQFPIDNNALFKGVNCASGLLYIPQKDTVYYFNQRQLKNSFFFTLYRPKGEQPGRARNTTLSKQSCTSVTLYANFLEKREKSLPKVSAACRAIYVMEDHKFKQEKDQRRELVPVIYLLCERKAYLPVGVGVYRIVHHDDFLSFTELPSTAAPGMSPDNVRSPIFSTGLHFVLRMQKGLRFCFYTLVQGKGTLLRASMVSSEGKDSLAWGEEVMELNGCFEPKQGLQEGWRVEGHMLCSGDEERDFKHSVYSPIIVTDLVGAPGNNEFRILGENKKNGRVVEVVMTCVQGSPQWRIFDLA